MLSTSLVAALLAATAPAATAGSKPDSITPPNAKTAVLRFIFRLRRPSRPGTPPESHLSAPGRPGPRREAQGTLRPFAGSGEFQSQMDQHSQPAAHDQEPADPVNEPHGIFVHLGMVQADHG